MFSRDETLGSESDLRISVHLHCLLLEDKKKGYNLLMHLSPETPTTSPPPTLRGDVGHNYMGNCKCLGDLPAPRGGWGNSSLWTLVLSGTVTVAQMDS